MIDEDSPHRLGRGGEELPSSRPSPIASRELEIGLVHKGGRLQRHAAGLRRKLTVGELVKLPVDEREQLLRIRRGRALVCGDVRRVFITLI